MVDDDGWGRYIGCDGTAFDLDPIKHKASMTKVLRYGARCTAPSDEIEPAITAGPFKIRRVRRA